jgi:hypothetical protein
MTNISLSLSTRPASSLVGGDPGPPDDREAHLNNRSGRAQLGEVRRGIAQVFLACELKAQHGVRS